MTVALRQSGASRGLSAKGDIIRHLYVHIPFCARICPYCAFYKELVDRDLSGKFCQAVVRELQARMADVRLRPSTIYFGGGTPTALTTVQLETLLGGFKDLLDLSTLAEWTMEANPGSVSDRKAALLRSHGVNRISLGVQSWDEELLKTLGREHDAGQAERSYRLLRAEGFDNINIDLMFDLPGQSMEQWIRTLEQTAALAPEHVSAYSLTFEEGTEFFRRFHDGEFSTDQDRDADLFDATRSVLEAAGYLQYEVSNYARPGFESVHNRAYWTGEDYLGLGPGAFSTIGNRRDQNICDYRRYIELVFAGEKPVGASECLTNEMKRSERIALGLRTRTGLPVALVANQLETLEEFIRLGLVEPIDRNVILTPAGRLVADSVAEALL